MAHTDGAVKVVVKGPAFNIVSVLEPVLFVESSKRHCALWASKLCHAPQ